MAQSAQLLFTAQGIRTVGAAFLVEEADRTSGASIFRSFARSIVLVNPTLKVSGNTGVERSIAAA